MKTHWKFITLLIVALFFAVLTALRAATLTIQVPDQDVARVQEAFGSINNLGRPATTSEVQYAIQAWLKNSTLDYERRKNTYQYSPTPMNFSPTPTATP